MVTLISYPDALSLSQNLKKIVASADGQSAFLLYKNGELVIDETYFPDESGTIEIDIRELVTSLLSVSVPTSDTFTQNNSVADFTATIGDKEIVFRTVKGGIAGSTRATDWLAANFLTWQPQIKSVTYMQPEWLTYYAQEDCHIKCRLYNQDKSNTDIILATISAGQCISVNTQFARIINLNETAKLAYYDIWVESLNTTRLSYAQRYILRDNTSQENYFIFENSVGGMDAVSFTGNTNLEAETEHELAAMDDMSIQASQKMQQWLQQSTGYKSAYEAKWLQDFFTSPQRYVCKDGQIKEIVIQDSALSDSSSEAVKEYSFKYRPADDRGLLQLDRDMAMPANIEFPTADQIFFLAPRLSDFSEAEINPFLVIPVQSPYEEVWYRISVGSIQTLMQQMVVQGLEGNVHDHWNKQVLNDISEVDGELAYKGQKLNLAFLQIIGIDNEGNVYIRDKEDGSGRSLSTNGLFVSNGFRTKKYLQGILGHGASIDQQGNAELHSLVVRTFLEVPELRYNRVDVKVGDKWRAPGGGIIERVEQDPGATTGTGWLKLEEGEIGAIAVDDICMGIFHNFDNKTANASQDYDDGKGNREFSGFCTVYFRITEVTDIADENGVSWHHKRFRYTLRPTSATWSKQMHPMQYMNFVCYGNFTNKDRQTSVYETRTYTRYLASQNSWEISLANIMKQEGDLSNLKSAFGMDLTGYSSYQKNIYVTGAIKQVKEDGTPILTANDRGEWIAGTTAAYYDRFSFKGALWLCVAEAGTNTEPSANDPAWLCQVNAGSSITPGSKWDSTKVPYPVNSMLSFAGKIVISNRETSEPPYPLIIDKDGNYITTSDGYYILASTTLNDSWFLLLDTPDLTNGKDGDGLQVRYSVDGKSWHTTFAVGDIYMQQRVGDGTWTDAIRIVGEKGEDGVAAEYTTFEFAVNESLTEAPTSGWQDAPPPVGKGQHLWLRTGIIIPPATAPETWTCARISGEKGDKGEDGISYNQRGEWTTDKMPAAKMDVFTMAGVMWVARCETSNPPLFTMLDKSGNRIIGKDGGYILSGTVNTAEYDKLIESGKDGKDGQDGKDGAQGPQGIAGTNGMPGLPGCIVRYAEWQAGYEWRNDEAATTGTRYLDVAFVSSNTAASGWNVYKCKVTHVSADDNAPGNATFWEEFSVNVPAIFTNVILGKSAHIDLMQGNDLLIKKPDATVTTGMSGTQDGDKTRIWAGATKENKDVAPFSVNEDGIVTAEMFRTARGGCRMEAENGVISIFGSIAKNIEFGVNEEGLAILRYYDNDGTMLYDLGPNGLSSVKRDNDSWRLMRLAYVGSSQAEIFTEPNWRNVQWPFYRLGTNYYQFLSGYIGNVMNDSKNNRKVFTAQNKTTTIPDGWYVEVNNDGYIALTERETYIPTSGAPTDMKPQNPNVNTSDPIYIQRVVHYLGGQAFETIKTYFNIYIDRNEEAAHKVD